MECKALIVCNSLKNMVLEDLANIGVSFYAVSVEGGQTLVFKRNEAYSEAIEAWNRRA